MTFTDNFTGTSGDLLDSRTGWSLVGSEGAYQAQIYTDGATLQCKTTGSGSGATTYACTDQGTADHYVTYKRISFTSYSANEVCVRYVDGSNYLSHRLAGTGSSGSRLSKVVSGTRTELIQVQGAANDVNKIECSGSDVSFFINGTQQGSTQTVTDHQSETTAALIFGIAAAVSLYDDYETGALGGGGQTGELTDSLALTASDSGTAHFLASISDQFGLGSGSAGTAAYIAALIDNMAVGDVVSGVAGLVAALSDSMALTGAESASTLAVGALSDSLSLSDQAASVAHLFALLSDTATLSDAAGALLRAKASVADIIALADTHGGVGGFIASLVDNLSFVDEVASSTATGATGSLSDVLSVGDANTAVGHYTVTVNDSITVTDAAAGIAKYLQTLADIFSLTDVVGTIVSVNGPVTVSVTVLQATVTLEVVTASTTYEVI